MTKSKKLLNNMPICRFCEKEFKLERTLMTHVCVKKNRFADKETRASRIGFSVFQQYYAETTKSKNPKTFEDFISSQFYNDFIKFGKYLCDLNPVSTPAFLSFIFKNSLKITDWTKKEVYDAFLLEFLRKENVERALERTFINIQEWCEKNNAEIKDFFNKISTFELTFLIRTGAISPWLIYLSDTGSAVFENFSTEQADLVKLVIDPDYWAYVFKKNPEDVEFVNSIVEAVGI